jgi:hypothetical protein
MCLRVCLCLCACAVCKHPTYSLAIRGAQSLFHTLMWVFLGALLLVISGYVNEYLIVRFYLGKGSLLDGNAALAVVELGHFVASAVIIRATIAYRGLTWTDVSLCLVNFCIGQGFLAVAVAAMQVSALDSCGVVVSRRNVPSAAARVPLLPHSW